MLTTILIKKPLNNVALNNFHAVVLAHEINKHSIVEAGVHIPRTFG